MSALEEYYKTLELKPGASPEQIKRAYRRLAKQWHPDRVSPHPQLRRQCEEKMRKINEAYEYLREHPVEPSPASASEPSPKPDPPPKPAPRPEPRPRAQPQPEPDPESDPRPEPHPQPEAQETWLREAPQPPDEDAGIEPWTPHPQRASLRNYARRKAEEYASLGKVAFLFLLSIAAMAGFFFSNQLNQPAEHPYYGLLRLLIFSSSLYGAFYALMRGLEDLLLVLLPVAFIFNPVLPLSISPQDWIIFNFVTPVIFVCVFFEMYRKRQRPG